MVPLHPPNFQAWLIWVTCSPYAHVSGSGFWESLSDSESSDKVGNEQHRGARQRKSVLRTQLSEVLFGENPGKTTECVVIFQVRVMVRCPGMSSLL